MYATASEMRTICASRVMPSSSAARKSPRGLEWLRMPCRDFPSEVESASLALDTLDDVEALAAVPEAAGENVVELVFADVTEGGVSEVVAQGDGFGEVFI